MGRPLGTLKMRDMKQRERNQWHQNAGVETAGNGNNGTKLQELENARHEYLGKAEYGKSLIVKINVKKLY